MRRWIDADKLPEPYLTCTHRGYKVYTVGELEVIARHIAQHEREFVYLVATSSDTVEMLQQAVHAYRAQYI